MTATLPRRLSRPETAKPFQITERDIRILRAIARWRFMTSDQIVAYLLIIDPTTSHQHVLRRLMGLFRHGYIDRPENQTVFFTPTAHLVYAIAHRGAQLLRELGDDIADVRWTLKNQRAAASNLPHALETTEAMIMCEHDAHARGLSLLDHHALIPYFPEATRTLRKPFRLRVTFEHGGTPVTRSVVPDRLVSVLASQDQRWNFAMEIDRATMKVKPRKPSPNSNYARKIATYFAAWHQDRHRTQWGFKSFRVLTITPTDAHIRTMLDAQREITRDRLSSFFLYTTRERLLAANFFGPIWTTADHETIALLDPAKAPL